MRSLKVTLEKYIKNCDKAIWDNPYDYNIHYQRGLAYLALNNYDKAIFDLEEVIRLFPINVISSNFVDIYFYIGKAYADQYRNNLSDLTKALHSFNTYIKNSKNKELLARAQVYYSELNNKINRFVDLKQ